MQAFAFTITETTEKTITISAETLQEATDYALANLYAFDLEKDVDACYRDCAQKN